MNSCVIPQVWDRMQCSLPGPVPCLLHCPEYCVIIPFLFFMVLPQIFVSFHNVLFTSCFWTSWKWNHGGRIDTWTFVLFTYLYPKIQPCRVVPTISQYGRSIIHFTSLFCRWWTFSVCFRFFCFLFCFAIAYGSVNVSVPVSWCMCKGNSLGCT